MVQSIIKEGWKLGKVLLIVFGTAFMYEEYETLTIAFFIYYIANMLVSIYEKLVDINNNTKR